MMKKLFTILLLMGWIAAFPQAGMMLQKTAVSGAPDTTHVELTFAIANSGDDCEQIASGTTFTTSSDLELTWDGEQQWIGLGFRSVNIPQGSEIVSAYVQFTSDQDESTAMGLILYGDDSDNAVLPFENTNNVTSRTQTTASVTWNPAAWTNNNRTANQRSPDLKTIIQEIVDRGGFSSGNNIAILIYPESPGDTDKRRADSFDGASSAADYPEITIKYVQNN